MTHPVLMDDNDRVDVIKALAAWFESQDISMADALPILATLSAAVILGIAERYDKDPDEGARAFCKGIMSAVKAAQEK